MVRIVAISSGDGLQTAADALLTAALQLKRGGLVVGPTDTCYGLMAAARNPQAAARLNQLKGRAPITPLAVLVARRQDLWEWGRCTALAAALAHRFLPGPLTLVLESLSPPDTRHLSPDTTVAVRVPDHPLVRVLCTLVPQGLAATSANRSGLPAPASAKPAEQAWGEVDNLLILDAGPLAEARESTVVDARSERIRIIREGAISRDTLNQCTRGAKHETRYRI